MRLAGGNCHFFIDNLRVVGFDQRHMGGGDGG
jgi:hypothetical protein